MFFSVEVVGTTTRPRTVIRKDGAERPAPEQAVLLHHQQVNLLAYAWIAWSEVDSQSDRVESSRPPAVVPH